jgi:hypothetical protein
MQQTRQFQTNRCECDCCRHLAELAQKSEQERVSVIYVDQFPVEFPDDPDIQVSTQAYLGMTRERMMEGSPVRILMRADISRKEALQALEAACKMVSNDDYLDNLFEDGLNKEMLEDVETIEELESQMHKGIVEIREAKKAER